MTAPRITQRDRAAAAVPLRLLAAAGLSVVGFTGIERIARTVRRPGAEGQLGEGGVGIYAASILDRDGAKVKLAAVVWSDDGQSAVVEWTLGKGHREQRRLAVSVEDDGRINVVNLTVIDSLTAELRGGNGERRLSDDARSTIHLDCPKCGATSKRYGFNCRGQFCECGWRR